MGKDMIMEKGFMHLLNDAKATKARLDRAEGGKYFDRKLAHFMNSVLFDGRDYTCNRDVDSFECSAVLLYTMCTGFEDEDEFRKLEKCIRASITNPYTCNVTQWYDSTTGKFTYTYGDKKMLPYLHITPDEMKELTEDIIDAMDKNIHFGVGRHEVKTLISALRDIHNKYAAKHKEEES